MVSMPFCSSPSRSTCPAAWALRPTPWRSSDERPSAECRVPSAECWVLSAEYRVPSTESSIEWTTARLPALSTQHSALGTRHSALSTDFVRDDADLHAPLPAVARLACAATKRTSKPHHAA